MKKSFKQISKQISASIFLTFIFFLSATSVYAVDPVPANCDSTRGIVTCCEGSNCDFTQFMLAIQKLLNRVIEFALGFSVVVISIAGWKYLTSGANAGEREKANKMFVSVGWGIAYCLGAWLIVNLIMTTLVGGNITNFLTNSPK